MTSKEMPKIVVLSKIFVPFYQFGEFCFVGQMLATQFLQLILINTY